MKIFTGQTFALLLLVLGLSFQMKAQYVTIPDDNFRAYLQQTYPACFNGNGEMDTTCAGVVNGQSLSIIQAQISNLEGVQYFNNLEYLDCSENSLTSLPPLPQSLTFLMCSYNQLTQLPALPQALENLYCDFNHLTSLPTLPPALYYLWCNDNQFTTLPALPQGLNFLECSSNQLTSLPALPQSLGFLNIGANNLSIMPVLPQSLYEFYCNNNDFVSLPALPITLEQFDCSENHLTNLPPLPQLLSILWCGYNPLTNLPPLPQNLQQLECSANHLSSLPNLPQSLTYLACLYNNLTSLPPLPQSLIVLDCRYNHLISLPDLPPSIEDIYCENNNLTCIPLLPESLRQIYFDNNPIGCLPNIPPSCFSCPGHPLCPPNQICTGDQAYCSGNAFIDLNNDGLMNNGEVNYPSLVVGATPGDHASANTYSGYRIPLDTNAQSIITSSNPFPYALNSVPSSYTVVSNGPGEVPGNYDFALQTIPNINNLELYMSTWPVRPGFNTWVNFRVINAGSVVASPLVTFSIPPDWVVLNTSPQGMVNGNAITWQDPGLAAFDHHDFYAQFNIPVFVPLGTPYTYTASVPIGNDVTPNNNTATYSGAVTGAFDPNDKACNTNELLPGYDPEQELLYTVRFQNTGNDTAFTIVVLDTLSQYLRANTVRLINTSHNCNLSFIDESHVLSFIFPNILLVDSFANEPLSHGFVQFAVKPQPNLPIGTSIENTADIYFDYNAPVRTNTVATNVDIVSVPHLAFNSDLKIYPNPTDGRLRIEAPMPMANGSLVSISNMMGQTQLTVSCSGVVAEVSLEGLPTGVYSVAVMSEGRILYRGMVVRR